jgi:ribonuclease HII
MAWIIGIDEAGYGPNLGPLVMSSVAWHVPDALAAANLWQVLKSVARRGCDPDEGQLLVDDSKVVHSAGQGLRALEANVLAALAPWAAEEGQTLTHYVERVCPDSHADLSAECWFAGTSTLPSGLARDAVAGPGARFEQGCRDASLRRGPVQSVAVCTPHFNAIADGAGTKGAVLAHGLARLLRKVLRDLDDEESVHVYIDKHGGRNTYAAMLQDALEDGIVIASVESNLRSTYRVAGLSREVSITFQPRADGEHFCVALASMASKYLRELLMGEFNRFWQGHVPGLSPTAGYPLDAARFFRAIRPAMEKLGLAESVLWRKR